MITANQANADAVASGDPNPPEGFTCFVCRDICLCSTCRSNNTKPGFVKAAVKAPAVLKKAAVTAPVTAASTPAVASAAAAGAAPGVTAGDTAEGSPKPSLTTTTTTTATTTKKKAIRATTKSKTKSATKPKRKPAKPKGKLTQPPLVLALADDGVSAARDGEAAAEAAIAAAAAGIPSTPHAQPGKKRQRSGTSTLSERPNKACATSIDGTPAGLWKHDNSTLFPQVDPQSLAPQQLMAPGRTVGAAVAVAGAVETGMEIEMGRGGREHDGARWGAASADGWHHHSLSPHQMGYPVAASNGNTAGATGPSSATGLGGASASSAVTTTAAATVALVTPNGAGVQVSPERRPMATATATAAEGLPGKLARGGVAPLGATADGLAHVAFGWRSHADSRGGLASVNPERPPVFSASLASGIVPAALTNGAPPARPPPHVPVSAEASAALRRAQAARARAAAAGANLRQATAAMVEAKAFSDRNNKAAMWRVEAATKLKDKLLMANELVSGYGGLKRNADVDYMVAAAEESAAVARARAAEAEAEHERRIGNGVSSGGSGAGAGTSGVSKGWNHGTAPSAFGSPSAPTTEGGNVAMPAISDGAPNSLHGTGGDDTTNGRTPCSSGAASVAIGSGNESSSGNANNGVRVNSWESDWWMRNNQTPPPPASHLHPDSRVPPQRDHHNSPSAALMSHALPPTPATSAHLQTSNAARSQQGITTTPTPSRTSHNSPSPCDGRRYNDPVATTPPGSGRRNSVSPAGSVSIVEERRQAAKKATATEREKRATLAEIAGALARAEAARADLVRETQWASEAASKASAAAMHHEDVARSRKTDEQAAQDAARLAEWEAQTAEWAAREAAEADMISANAAAAATAASQELEAVLFGAERGTGAETGTRAGAGVAGQTCGLVTGVVIAGATVGGGERGDVIVHQKARAVAQGKQHELAPADVSALFFCQVFPMFINCEQWTRGTPKDVKNCHCFVDSWLEVATKDVTPFFFCNILPPFYQRWTRGSVERCKKFPLFLSTVGRRLDQSVLVL